MGQGMNHEDLQELQESLTRSNFIHYITGFISGCITYVSDLVFYGPGNGKLYSERKIKHRIGTVKSYQGDITLPLMKMINFDLIIGFFLEDFSIEDGLHDLKAFRDRTLDFPKHKEIMTLETYWVLNYRRPKDVHGKQKIIFYILNEFDNLIYIKNIENNDIIDYEEIIQVYENAVLSKDMDEREMVNITNYEYCFNENCTNVSRKQKDL